MATLTLHMSDELKALAVTRAAEAGFKDLDQFVAQLIRSEATGAPVGLTIDSDDDLEVLLASRVDGPFVDMDAADFQQIRDKYTALLRSRIQE